MGRKALSLFLGLGVAVSPTLTFAQSGISDAEIVRGIRQVEEGDYDAAILTLDQAARRLAAEPKASRDLGQAYLYLGIAYLGKGHEAVARAKFREAVNRMDVSLTPDKYSPRVIDLVEAVKEEARTSAAGNAAANGPANGPAPAPVTRSAAPAADGGKGGSKALWIGLGIVAVGAGAYFVFKGEECLGSYDFNRLRPC